MIAFNARFVFSNVCQTTVTEIKISGAAVRTVIQQSITSKAHYLRVWLQQQSGDLVTKAAQTLYDALSETSKKVQQH